MARIIAAVVLVAVVGLAAAPSQTSPPPAFRTALFRFEIDEFWLNLHHFLYVLGRSVAKTTDASRDAVVKAPDDSRRGLAMLDEAQVATGSIIILSDGVDVGSFETLEEAIAHARQQNVRIFTVGLNSISRAAATSCS